MQTERFNTLRKGILTNVFEKNKIVQVWRGIVKDQLRKLDIRDIFDYYDFNYNIEERTIAIRNDILSGNYKVSRPLIYRIEKKYGVCRHIIIPQPTDALILQVITESVSNKILSHQPSEKVFYSRDKHNVKKAHNISNYGLNWQQQWKKLQKEIYKFEKERKFIIVTDLSNYFDSIDIQELRKQFHIHLENDHVLSDLLFRIIEEISWKPDYLPYSGRGLPTSNIEGIRLLAHSFLFELDIIVKEKTDNNFTRWMDDIIIGIDSKREAIELISTISDILKSKGLSLNLSKTEIYNSEDAYYNFQIEANQDLDFIENIKENDPLYDSFIEELKIKLQQHFSDTQPKYWDKVAKRFITAFGKLKSSLIVSEVPSMYLNYPILRPNLLIYLSQIGYSEETAEVVLKIINEINIFDDISLCQLCYLITDWQIPQNEISNEFLKNFEATILNFSFRRNLPFDIYCIIWLKAKYSHPIELLEFIAKYQNKWQSDYFLRRQVTVVLTRLLNVDRQKVNNLLISQISSGVISVVSIASQIVQFAKLKKLDKRLTSYLFPPTKQKIYPLAKFLVLCSVLNSEHIRQDNTIRHKIKKYIKDPYYLKWLDVQYDIN